MHVPGMIFMLWLLLTSCLALPCNERKTGAASSGPRTTTGACTRPLVRKEWRTLTTNEKRQYIGAVKCLQSKPPQLQEQFTGSRSRYDDFVGSHISRTGFVHFNGLFHPWHRMMVAQFEMELRSACHYKGAQPYWDWSLDATSEEAWIHSPIFSPVDGFGGNGPYVDSSEDPAVLNRIPGKTGGGCVPDGPFSEDRYVVAMGPGVYTNPNPRCLRRDFAPSFAVSKCSASEIDWSQSAETFAEFDRRVQGDVSLKGMTYHPGGHFGVGGELGDLANQFSSPSDPLFYVHHANVDRLWAKWQAKDKKKRTKDIAGPVIQFAPPFRFFPDSPEDSWPVTLDTPMYFSGLRDDVSVGAVMDTTAGRLCYTYNKL